MCCDSWLKETRLGSFVRGKLFHTSWEAQNNLQHEQFILLVKLKLWKRLRFDLHFQLSQILKIFGKWHQFEWLLKGIFTTTGKRPSTTTWRRPSAPLKEPTPFQWTGRSSHQTAIHPYLLRKSNKTPHGALVFSANPGNEARVASPSTLYDLATAWQTKGKQALHASPDPTTSGRPRGRPKGIKRRSPSVLRYE